MDLLKIVVVPPCNTYGDTLSTVALTYYLLNYYKHVILFIQSPVVEYYTTYYNGIKENITVCDHIDAVNYIKNGAHVCNLHTGDWTSGKHNYLFYNEVQDTDYYFCDTNPLYMRHIILDKHLTKPNIHLPLLSIEVNSIVYYKMVGLNNNVRMDFFNYTRNIDTEKSTTHMVLDKHDIRPLDKYNIINSHETDLTKKILGKIYNGYKCINICNLVKFPGHLLDLIEKAETCHLVEGCNTNFIYYCQYKGIMNKIKIDFHQWARNRSWPHYNLDESWKMYTNPVLDCWLFHMQ